MADKAETVWALYVQAVEANDPTIWPIRRTLASAALALFPRRYHAFRKRRYYASHPEVRLAEWRRYHQTHRELEQSKRQNFREYDRQYELRRGPEGLERKRRYRRTHPGQDAERSRKWRETHPKA